MNSHAVLILLLAVFSATSSEDLDYGNVNIYGTTVELRCPGDIQTVKWLEKGQVSKKNNLTFIMENYSEEKDGLYSCESDGQIYKYYIKAVVCENCYDLDMTLAIGVIVGDVLITLGVVLIVYLCARQKSDTIPPQRATRQEKRGPPVPNPDYQELNAATRSNDIYAHAHR